MNPSVHHTPRAPAARPGGPGLAVTAGTHRVRRPEETWEWIRPLLPRCGVTRVAEVTWLDDIGIPVFQAIRPNARTLSVSQGKGITRELARVSAAMEAVELWHSEHPVLPTVTHTVEEVRADLGYRVDALPLAPRHHLGPDCRLDWYPAARVLGGRPSLLPASLLRLDARVAGRWAAPSFRATSNGLAGGNTVEEALLHAMYEVIERDASARAGRYGTAREVDPSSVEDPSARDLLARFAAAGVRVRVRFLPSPFGVPSFDAVIKSATFPVGCGGAGTHLDPGVALCRALTEAAQSRATAIAGARDDIGPEPYRDTPRAPADVTPAPPLAAVRDATRAARPSVASPSFGDLREVTAQVADVIESVTGFAPLHIDLTRPGIGIPVVHVVCPGALAGPGH
ncbi:YcaO-like family protein [Streptomyces sp. RM72]|uniref:YcaO-like family protein n=1 Tax=Streptomyces sp. RM72 TaxID=1115510 RepID=UPI001B386577|nr:YcaO-like family protein [Streptomyces sp. RM72]MBQ0891085.1 YcaO-like family protein [Streptomyces sp. RM72]